MDRMTCPECSDNFIINNKTVICSYCKSRYHNMCVEIKDMVSKAVADNDNLVWFCNTCVGIVMANLELLPKLNMLEKKTEEILKSVTDTVSKADDGDVLNGFNKSKHRSYSRAVSEGVVIVRPSTVCDSMETKKKIRENINPIELGIGIADMKDAKEGAVIVKCRDSEDAKKLKRNLEQTMGEYHEAVIPHKRKPCVKIVGIERGYREEDLINALKLQNKGIIHSDSHLKMIICKKMVKTYFAILECDPKTFQSITTKSYGRLFIDCKGCRCFEYVSVIRCYNCNQFGHMSKDCISERICGKCSGLGHETKNCTNSSNKCINCKLFNDKSKSNLAIDHSAYDVECPTYCRAMDRERVKIQYSQE